MTRLYPHAHLLLLLGCAATVGAALVSQYGFGLDPCVLCLYQRGPYYVAVALLAVTLPWRHHPRIGRLILALVALAMLIDAGIAFFHVGVEHKWWEGTASCGGAVPEAKSLDDLRAQLLNKQPARCDEPALVVLGLSMAGWNMLVALGLAAFAATAARRSGLARA